MIGLILAGGSGSRLWPLSRKNYPKQFLRLKGNKSLLQKTAERLLKLLKAEQIITITNTEYKFHVIHHLEAISKELAKNIILEPARRNTAPAIALAVKYLKERLNCGDEEVIFVSPSDHIIEPEEKFIDYLRQAEEVAKKGYIVTFGIKPTRPETGYGYIKVKDIKKLSEQVNYLPVESFTEKPDLATAKVYLEDGNYFWNSGMFAFTLGTIIEEYKKFQPEIAKIFSMSYDEALLSFESLPDISIDYAIMEKSGRIVNIPLEIYWNDIGSFDSLFEVFEKDNNSNIRLGDVIAVDTRESLIIGNKRLIATVGLEDFIIIETDDAILVAKRGKSQKVKEIVEMLNFQNRPEAIEHKTVYRPWGEYTILEEGNGYRIKKIVIKPGEKLSLQLHHHRSEHWIVISGTAKVIIGDREFSLHENESAYVPKSTPHRLENPGKIPLEIIEVQNGEYIGENGIKVFSDLSKSLGN